MAYPEFELEVELTSSELEQILRDLEVEFGIRR